MHVRLYMVTTIITKWISPPLFPPPAPFPIPFLILESIEFPAGFLVIWKSFKWVIVYTWERVCKPCYFTYPNALLPRYVNQNFSPFFLSYSFIIPFHKYRGLCHYFSDQRARYMQDILVYNICFSFSMDWWISVSGFVSSTSIATINLKSHSFHWVIFWYIYTLRL